MAKTLHVFISGNSICYNRLVNEVEISVVPIVVELAEMHCNAEKNFALSSCVNSYG